MELSISSELLYSLSKKFMIGAGADILYDETRMVYSNHNIDPVSTNAEAIDVGIHLTALLNISRLQILIRSGLPFYSGSKQYWNVYNTFGIKYYVSDRFFISVYHKSQKQFFGDNLQWGFGYSIFRGHHNFK